MNYLLSLDIWGTNPDTYGSYIYKAPHLVSMAIFIVMLAGILVGVYYLAKKSEKHYQTFLKCFAIWMLVFEIVWRVVFLILGDEKTNIDYPWYPAYPCNLNAILIPIAVLCNSKTMKHMFYVFGIVGAVLMMVYPTDIFTQPYIALPPIKSLVQHWNLFVIPCAEILTHHYKVRFRNYWVAWLGMLVHVINSTFLTWILNKIVGDSVFPYLDYIFFRFFGDTEPGYVIVPAVGTLVMGAIFALSDIKGFKACMAQGRDFIKNYKLDDEEVDNKEEESNN